MYKDNTEISRVEGLIPEQLISDSAPLIEFLKEYYKYLNQDNNPSAVINSMMANRDLDFAVDRFIDLIRKEIGEGIVKNVVDEHRGTLSFTSTQEKTIFSIRFPLQEVH